MSELKQSIKAAMLDSMRSKNKPKLLTIRTLQASIKQQEIDKRIELDDQQIISIITKMIKQRNESIKQFKAGARSDLAEVEEFEITVLQQFLPPAMTEAEISAEISDAIKSCAATSIRDMGKIMGILKQKLNGRADMSKVGEIIKNQLTET